MVLHKNKWDRKATKAHERKLKAAGKVVGGAAGSTKAEEKSVKDGGPVPALGAPPAGSEARGDEKEGEAMMGNQSGSEADEQSGSDEGGSATFRKRTLQNNAWRYEEEGEIPGAEPVIEDPEPDYSRLTIGKEIDFSHPSSTISKNNAPLPIEDTDEEFLRESFQTSCTFTSTSVPPSSRARLGRDEDGGDKARRVVRVPKSQFVDVTEKISKQTTAEAFRQRFGTRKTKPRPELEVEEDDDLDSFFEELDRVRDGAHRSKTVTATSSNTFTATSSFTPEITTPGGVPVPGSLALGSREISSGLGRSSGLPNKDDKDDEWLDAMLGGK